MFLLPPPFCSVRIGFPDSACCPMHMISTPLASGAHLCCMVKSDCDLARNRSLWKALPMSLKSDAVSLTKLWSEPSAVSARSGIWGSICCSKRPVLTPTAFDAPLYCPTERDCEMMKSWDLWKAPTMFTISPDSGEK